MKGRDGSGILTREASGFYGYTEGLIIVIIPENGPQNPEGEGMG